MGKVFRKHLGIPEGQPVGMGVLSFRYKTELSVTSYRRLSERAKQDLAWLSHIQERLDKEFSFKHLEQWLLEQSS